MTEALDLLLERLRLLGWLSEADWRRADYLAGALYARKLEEDTDVQEFQRG